MYPECGYYCPMFWRSGKSKMRKNREGEGEREGESLRTKDGNAQLSLLFVKQ